MTKCRHYIYHPQNREERKEIKNALDRARKTGDTEVIPIFIEQLTNPCAWKEESDEDSKSAGE